MGLGAAQVKPQRLGGRLITHNYAHVRNERTQLMAVKSEEMMNLPKRLQQQQLFKYSKNSFLAIPE